MIIIEDKANKQGLHEIKNEYWQRQGIPVERYPLPVGDYILVNDKVQDVIDRKSKRGIEVKKMDFLGSYKICIDTKKDIQELIGDICGKQHDRFRDELVLAQNNGVKLIILVEDDGGYCDYKKTIYNKPVLNLDDLFRWKNPRLFIWKNGKQLYPTATKGSVLAKACKTMEKKYGCSFQFCRKSDAGRKIIELLIGDGTPSDVDIERTKYGRVI